jgi:hypothetical protein
MHQWEVPLCLDSYRLAHALRALGADDHGGVLALLELADQRARIGAFRSDTGRWGNLPARLCGRRSAHSSVGSSRR